MLLLAFLLCGCGEDSRSDPAAAHATRDGRTIHLEPSQAEFQIPELWLEKQNLHLTRTELKRVENGAGEWDTEYGAVVNSVLPFSHCAAHVGSEGWGREAVSFADLQMRAYVVEMTPDEIWKKLESDGTRTASIYSKTVSTGDFREGDWSKYSIDFRLLYGDYGGFGQVDMYARRFGEQTAVLVFMHSDRDDHDKTVKDILGSFTWKSVE